MMFFTRMRHQPSTAQLAQILRAAMVFCATLVLLIACAKSPGTGQAPAHAVAPASEVEGNAGESPEPVTAVPKMPIPQPPREGALLSLDRSCTVDADCAVKDVGNCCGMLPACVNVAAEPDPARVQADCAAAGRSSICGFQELSGCQCVDSQCVGIPGGSQLR